MNGSLVADLGIGPGVWLFFSLLMCITLFFKFSRFWSVRNLDLVLLFALAPGMMILVGDSGAGSWWAYLWLFTGSLCWLIRCLIDLGLTRRPILEPNLNLSGLACLTAGLLGLMILETVTLPFGVGTHRNPADPRTTPMPERPPGEELVDEIFQGTPGESTQPGLDFPKMIVRRIVAVLALVGLVIGLIAVGWRHFDRPAAGLSAAACYLVLPYPRFGLVDCGQSIPAALIVAAIHSYLRPVWSGLMIGLAASWLPACIGLIPLWAGSYRSRGFWKFTASGVGVPLLFGSVVSTHPGIGLWARALGSRTLSAAGFWPGVEAPTDHSFWSGIDPSYRLPVLIAYLILVIIATILPGRKNLGELIALSAAVLVASQFWFLESGGTLVLLYLPLVILMMFRPNLASRLVKAR